ncbi:hypothetical protein [Mycobacteroides salmoniphilum]|uniref:hypothetical protein n=1 Tax=Mycobacteroides salmoniphilum TaxID=404941 RepID=UPI0010655A9F|nr:hypothetical protein [Mycobacteroides salmoniphilum]
MSRDIKHPQASYAVFHGTVRSTYREQCLAYPQRGLITDHWTLVEVNHRFSVLRDPDAARAEGVCFLSQLHPLQSAHRPRFQQCLITGSRWNEGVWRGRLSHAFVQ